MNPILEIVERIKPILAGHPPGIQGAVLAELTSLWLAGHEPSQRDKLMKWQRVMISEFTKINRIVRERAERKLQGESK